VALGQLGGGDREPSPAGPPSSNVSLSPDPAVTEPDRAVAPAPLDADALTEAFHGQVTWTRGDAVPDTAAACVAVLGSEAESARTTEFRSGRALGAARTYARFASASDAAHVFNDLIDDMRACNSRQVAVGPVPLPQGRGVYAAVPADENNPGQLVWLVRSEDRVAILTVVGMQDTPPDDVRQSVADALLAGVLA
jgi:hypothetical protein